MLTRTTVAMVTALTLVSAPAVRAQDPGGSGHRWSGANWIDDLGFLTINAAASGLAGGLSATLRGDASFAEGFLEGSLGGAVVYGGKRLSAARFEGAGAVGRVVVSLGSSAVQEAGREGWLRRFAIPYGPLRLYVDRDAGTLRLKPDLVATYWTAYGLAHGSLDLDVGRSLSAGVAVFVADGAELEGVNGTIRGGTIFMNPTSDELLEDVFAHERIHVAQWDHAFLSGGQAAESWAADRLGLGGLSRIVDIGLVPAALMGSAAELAADRTANPFEVEADFLEWRTGQGEDPARLRFEYRGGPS